MTKLAGIFSDGMILQRGRPCAIWGQDDGADEIVVILEGKEYSSIVEEGKFLVTLPPHEEAVGVTIEIIGSTKIVLSDVCFGDVFYLAGQSNFELPVSRTLDVSREEVEASNYPYIRQYRVTPQYLMAEDRIADLPELPWTSAVPGEIGQMSAAGFYCAKRIYDRIRVPIGLVLGAQGGSTIESWMPASLLSQFGDHSSKMEPFMEGFALREYLAERDKQNGIWRASLKGDNEEELIRSIPEGATDFEVPGMIRENTGKEHVGIVWFYKEVELTEEPGEEAFLYLGDLIDADETFVNGVSVGRIEYRYPPRKYPFDGRILRKGKNLITVRLLIETGNGGFVAAHPYYLRTDKEQVELEGTWKVFFGEETKTLLTPGVMGQQVPTSLYKASVLPLKDYSFRGLWWYQGESNTDDPSRYNEKFKCMIDNWRELYGQKLPLICIEMCDYQDPLLGGTPEGWATIQKMQRDAAEEVSRCEVVSAKDLTSPWELHPQRKSELGERMAQTAMHLYY
ncbi:MAG: hypothetical protein J5379_03635 [Clostridiales bacterium]|nr:hypothetical protein [Clostridiales bacterium]